ncbi:acyl-CoA-binding domain-containing protein 6 [Cryptosporidium felis]|nr:acyl-CoA-binding domain-containing protein 6 [Cryptosporidium felis]
MTDILSTNKKFADAASFCANNVTLFNNDELLELYGFYKQATVGDSPEKSSSVFSMFSLKDQAKSKSWASRKGMSPEDAAENYIKLITKKDPQWEEKLGKNVSISISNSASCPVRTPESEQEKEDFEFKSILDQTLDDPNFCQENCSLIIYDAFCSQVIKNQVDFLNRVLERFPFLSNSCSSQSSSYALHFSCDKGLPEMTLLLLKFGADPNSKDSFGDTPLHVAAVSEQTECIRILLNHGADPSLQNDDGLKPVQVSQNAEVKAVFENH